MQKNSTMQDAIGLSAGQIYNYLAGQNSQVSFTKLKKDLDLKGNFADLGLGWLAREDKIDMSKSGNTIKVALK